MERKAFSKKASLDTTSFKLPTKIIGREREAEELVRNLLGYKDGYVVPVISVYGRSGTGKSTLVRYVCDYISELKLCYVNLRKAKTIFGAANLILSSLSCPNLKSAQGLNTAIERIQESIGQSIGSKKLFVLVLDEFDVIFYDKRNNPSDFIYKLVEMESELKQKGILCMIITISNNVLADYNIDDRVRSRIGTSEIFFRPYSKEEMLKILRQRAKEAFGKKIESKVLEYCAQLSYSEHGDARRAVDLLRVAAEIAIQEKKEITMQHVDAASKRLQKDRIIEVIQTLSYHSMLICLVLAAKTFGYEKDWHSTSSLYESYKKFIDKSESPVTYRRFSELLIDLENTGILKSQTGSRGQKGYRSEYMLLIQPEIVGTTIDEKWWNKAVVSEKKKFDEILPSGSIRKNDPMYEAYKKLAKRRDNLW